MSLAEFVRTFESDLAYKAPEQLRGEIAGFLRELVARYGDNAAETETQWCWFYGGPDPDNATCAHYADEEPVAREMAQWLIEGGVASRRATYSAWTVAPPDDVDERAAAIARQHQQGGRPNGTWGCLGCDWVQDKPHHEHVADMVAAARADSSPNGATS